MCAWFGLVIALSIVFRKNDCLPILMLLYIMLYIMLAYLTLFAALSNAVSLYYVSFLFLPFISANAYCFDALSWSIDT